MIPSDRLLNRSCAEGIEGTRKMSINGSTGAAPIVATFPSHECHRPRPRAVHAGKRPAPASHVLCSGNSRSDGRDGLRLGLPHPLREEGALLGQRARVIRVDGERRKIGCQNTT